MDPIATVFNIKQFFSATFSPLQVVLTLLLGFVAGLYIFFIYRKTFGGVMYSRSFNVSLILLTLVTTMVIMLISSNLSLSLGMVGALSIVRFRTAVKEPIDTVYMFWAVGEGIALGAQFYDVAVIGGLIIGLLMVVMSAVKVRQTSPYLLILHYREDVSQQVLALVKKLPGARLKSKTAQRDGIELTMELRLKSDETSFVEKFLRLDGVYDASLISHQGDIVG